MRGSPDCRTIARSRKKESGENGPAAHPPVLFGTNTCEGIIEEVSTYGGEPAPDAAQLEILGRLTRGALHELANPLLALLGNAELALAEGEAEVGTKLHRRLATIEQTALELSEIVRSLQAYLLSLIHI